MKCWHGYLSGMKCTMIFTWSSWCNYHPIISFSTKTRNGYLTGAGLPRLSWKKAINARCSNGNCSDSYALLCCYTALFKWIHLRAQADVIHVIIDVTGAAAYQAAARSPDKVAEVTVIRLRWWTRFRAISVKLARFACTNQFIVLHTHQVTINWLK